MRRDRSGNVPSRRPKKRKTPAQLRLATKRRQHAAAKTKRRSALRRLIKC